MNRINVALLGMGTIGLELIRRTMHRTAYRYVALGDRSGVIAKSCGFTESELARLIELKKGGYSLAESEGQFKEYEDMARLLDCVHVDALVDATDAQTYELLYKALGDTHVVISNKNPVADVPYEKFRRLITKAKEEERVLDFGTTAGAGMRIPEIISQLGCDGVDRFTGCLSGTMSYVSQRINDGRPLSAALKEAMEPPRNYAEPDPRVDLGGEDFARKLVIVGRMCGRGLEKEMVEVDKLIPEELKTIPVDSLIGMLAELDLEIERKIEKANIDGKVCWYVGTADLKNDEYTVGFKEIPREDSITRARESDNVLKLHPSGWRRPVTIIGPGAGPPETVTGLIFGLQSVSNSS